MALTCRWRSRPQHHNRTRSNLVLLSIVVEAFRMSDGGGKEAATIGYLCPIEFERKPGLA
jgi:hypothetical protein